MQETERQSLFSALLTPQLHEQAWRYASRLARSREDAEDLLQESLTAAYNKLHQLQQPGMFRSWLLTIIRNQNIKLARRQPPGFTETLWFQSVQQAAETDPEAAGLSLELAALPAGQRQLLVLFYLDGLSLEETGRLLRLSPAVVSQRLHRARQALRRRLEAVRRAELQPKGQTNEA